MDGLQPGLRRQGKKLAQAARLQATGQIVDTPDDDDDDDEPVNEVDAALAAFGMFRVESVHLAKTGICYIWPENHEIWRIWNRLQTQWRVGFFGRTGLDYAGVTAYLRDVWRVKDRNFAHIFMCIQTMEMAVLEEWEKKREQRQNKG